MLGFEFLQRFRRRLQRYDGENGMKTKKKRTVWYVLGSVTAAALAYAVNHL